MAFGVCRPSSHTCILPGLCSQHAAIAVTSAVVAPSYQYASGRFSMSRDRIRRLGIEDLSDVQGRRHDALQNVPHVPFAFLLQYRLDLRVGLDGMLEPDRGTDDLGAGGPRLLNLCFHACVSL